MMPLNLIIISQTPSEHLKQLTISWLQVRLNQKSKGCDLPGDAMATCTQTPTSLKKKDIDKQIFKDTINNTVIWFMHTVCEIRIESC